MLGAVSDGDERERRVRPHSESGRGWHAKGFTLAVIRNDTVDNFMTVFTF